EHIDSLSLLYKPNFDASQLSQAELLSCAHYHTYFQMDMPINSLENALYATFSEEEFKGNEWKQLSEQWQRCLASLLIKDKRLDTRLLKPYSDNCIANAQHIANNTSHHTKEELLFFNSSTTIYGAYNLPRFAIVKGTPRFTKLLVKRNDETQKKVNLRRMRDGYFFEGIIVDHTSSYALAKYIHRPFQDYIPLYDFIDFTTQKTTPDIAQTGEYNSSACCFGENTIYIALCKGDENILVKTKDIYHINTEEKEFITLNGLEGQTIVDIKNNKEGTCIAVATDKQLFIITVDDANNKKITMISQETFENDGYSIKKLSLNNKGSRLCVVMQPHSKDDGRWYKYDMPAKAYLCNTAKPHESIVTITQELQGTHDLRKYEYQVNRSCLSDIEQVCWSADDSLIILECSYRYQNFYQGRVGSSHFGGNQHAFVCAATGNGWSENEIRGYGAPVITSHDGRAIIITDKSGWFAYTKSLQWCDKHMLKALEYFDIKKPCPNFSIDQKLLAIVLLHKIMQDKDRVAQLNKEETEIYNKYIPDAIKKIMTKTHVILMHEDSFVSPTKQYEYKIGIRCKKFFHFLWEHKTHVLYCMGALLCGGIVIRHFSEIVRIAHSYPDHKPFGLVGMCDFVVLRFLVLNLSKFK